jgi:uncharacterized membrane protein
METIKKHKSIIVISIIFLTLYSLISIVNHYYFRTYALDLGLYTNAAYKYAHFQIADSTMINEYFEPILGGHFDLYLIIFSPLIYIFGTYTLLIVQIFALIIGGIGVYRYFQLFQDKNIPLYAAIYFYLFYGVFGALSFDYHSVVVASSIVPWFFVTLQQNRKWLSLLLLFSILISQENISLWLSFICLGLAVEHRKEKKITALLLFFAGISIVYFITITHYIIPSFSSNNEYGGFLYSCLGNDMFSAFKTLLSQPIESLKILFLNHNNSLYGDFVKIETHIILFTSGLFLLLKRPYYILMLLPIYFQKFYHDKYSMWGIGGQYNIEFTPILAIGIFSVISEFEKEKIRTVLSCIILFLVLISTFKTMHNTVFFTDKSQIRFYQKKHYQKDYNVKNVHEYLSKIPKAAKISAQSPFVPHLSLRDNIYEFPIIKDAEYIIFSRKENTYPMSNDDFEIKINELENSKDWGVSHYNELTILKKINW